MMQTWLTWLKKKFVIFLSKYDFPGDKTPIIRGSALKALQGDKGEFGAQAIDEINGCI